MNDIKFKDINKYNLFIDSLTYRYKNLDLIYINNSNHW